MTPNRLISVCHLSAVTAVLLASLAAPASAQAAAAAPGWYAEGGAGRSDARIDCAGTTRCDTSDTALRAIVGYAWSPTWAAEVSLAQLGRIRASATVPGAGEVSVSARLRSVGVGVAATLPLATDWSLVGRLGVASNRTRVGGSVGGFAGTDSESHAAPYVGVAVHRALSPATSLALTLDSTRVEYADTRDAVVAAGVALRWRF